jgi:hypothetical protein
MTSISHRTVGAVIALVATIGAATGLVVAHLGIQIAVGIAVVGILIGTGVARGKFSSANAVKKN